MPSPLWERYGGVHAISLSLIPLLTETEPNQKRSLKHVGLRNTDLEPFVSPSIYQNTHSELTFLCDVKRYQKQESLCVQCTLCVLLEHEISNGSGSCFLNPKHMNSRGVLIVI